MGGRRRGQVSDLPLRRPYRHPRHPRYPYGPVNLPPIAHIEIAAEIGAQVTAEIFEAG